MNAGFNLMGNGRMLLHATRMLIVLAVTLAIRVKASESLSEERLLNITFDQKLETQVANELKFRDEQGKTVTFGECFQAGKPTLLVLGYYGCPMLCSLNLNGIIATFQEMKWTAGKDFTVIFVSINPQESSDLARAKKENYLKRYGKISGEAGWHFLTGDEENIQQLANEVGFHYAYDPQSHEYAHPSGLIILTPEGKVSHYLFGVTYDARQLYGALQGASQQKIGSPIQRLVLLCFHYNPITGKYGRAIMFTIRLLGIATLAGMALVIWRLTRPTRAPVASGPSAQQAIEVHARNE